MSSDLRALAEIYLSVTDRFKDRSPFNSVRTFYHGLVLGDTDSKLSFMTGEEMDTLEDMAWPSYKEPIVVTIRSANHATQLVGFYVAYCRYEMVRQPISDIGNNRQDRRKSGPLLYFLGGTPRVLTAKSLAAACVWSSSMPYAR